MQDIEFDKIIKETHGLNAYSTYINEQDLTLSDRNSNSKIPLEEWGEVVSRFAEPYWHTYLTHHGFISNAQKCLMGGG